LHPPSTEQAATDTRRWGSQPHPSPSPGRRGEPEASSRSNHLFLVADKHACPGCQDPRPAWREPCDAVLRQLNRCFGRCCAAGRSCTPNFDASIPSDHLLSISSASNLVSSSKPIGAPHFPRPSRDRRRDAWFAAAGLVVLRLPNHLILCHPDRVLDEIRRLLAAHLPSPLSVRRGVGGEVDYFCGPAAAPDSLFLPVSLTPGSTFQTRS